MQNARPPRRRRLRAILLLLSAFAVVGAGATVVMLRTVRHPLHCGRARCADARAAGTSPTVHILSGLGLNGPTGAAYASGRLWVTNYADNSVSGFGWRSAGYPSVYAGEAYMFKEPAAITAGRRHLWVANMLANSVTELSTADGAPVRTITHVARPLALILVGRRLWVTNSGNGSVSEFSVRTGQLRKIIHGLHGPDALAVSNGKIWVANGISGTVSVLSATTGAWQTTLHSLALREPVAEVAGRNSLWVASEAGNSITQISTLSQRVVRRIAGPRYRLHGPMAMVLAGGALWVANMYGNSVTEIDAATGRLIRVLSGPRYGFDHPAGMAAYGGRVWVTNNGSASVTELRVRPGMAHPRQSR
jgi:DNA-binding beta-propeller fold protein YncE